MRKFLITATATFFVGLISTAVGIALAENFGWNACVHKFRGFNSIANHISPEIYCRDYFWVHFQNYFFNFILISLSVYVFFLLKKHLENSFLKQLSLILSSYLFYIIGRIIAQFSNDYIMMGKISIGDGIGLMVVLFSTILPTVIGIILLVIISFLEKKKESVQQIS